MAERDDIMKSSVGLDYSRYATGSLAFDYERLLADTGYDIDSTHRIQSQTAVGNTPVIELHNLVFRGDDPKGHELIANNAIHAGVVRGVGAPPPADSVAVDLSIAFDGKRVDQWSEIRWPDDILQAVGWLLEQLTDRGLTARAGQTLLTGALGPPIPVAEVNHVEVSSNCFGTVQASFH